MSNKKITGRTIRGLESVNLDNKSNYQKRKYLTKKAEQLGVKVPKYIAEGKISTKEAERFRQRLLGSADKKVYGGQSIEKEIERFNRKVENKIEVLRNQGVDERLIKLQQGEEVISPSFERTITLDSNKLEKLDYNSLNTLETNKRVRDNNIRELLKEKTRDLEKINYYEDIGRVKENNSFFHNDILNSSWIEHLGSEGKEAVREMWEGLNDYQQIVTIQGYLQGAKERYESMTELELVEVINPHFYNKFATIVNSVKSFD